MTTKIVMTKEYESVLNAINAGHKCVFINGKAGTGKTTLLHFMTSYFAKAKKNIVLVAPTGIAALQAGGSTINSFFRFPPKIITSQDIKMPKDPTLYKELDILFIDEAPMARADTIDGIDMFLRKVRKNKLPFGGVQVVLIGDLYQLPPVVTSEDLTLLEELGYDRNKGFYFFNALVYEKTHLKSIELTEIFRQKDRAFTDMLNKVRVAEDSANVVVKINQRCISDTLKPNPMAIVLATTNAIADRKNQEELAALPGAITKYAAERTKDFKFSGSNLPSPEVLELKVGAAVMFTANDSVAGEWVNGMLGKVVALGPKHVDVEVETGVVLRVEPHEWKSFESYIKDRKIHQKETGKYKQIPLVLGWAITIHKSQGKTLNHLHINLGTAAFASGQTYVALSRATSLEGITLARPIRASDIICCPLVKAYFNPVFELN